MNFALSPELTREIFIRKRIPAIRFLRDRLKPTGFVPGLGTCRDIVDQIQKGQAWVTNLGQGTETYTVRLGK